MKLGFYSKILGAAALLVLALPAGQARAADPTLGTYYGSGNPTGEWTITTQNGIELGLRAVYRFGSAITDNSGTYTANTGSTSCISGTLNCGLWNYNFSVDTGTSGLTLGDLNAMLTITGPSGSSGPINLLAIPDNNRNGISGSGSVTGTGPTDGSATAAQNSENLIFPLVGLPGFNPWVGGTYHFNLDVATKLDPSTVIANAQMDVNAVPEPASMALLGAGLLGLGLVRRRRHG